MAQNKQRYQVVIVGAGIAGASLAYALARRGVTDVLILEREFQPGYHSTGRSAAFLVTLDPLFPVMKLTIDSAPFFHNPPEGFCEQKLLDLCGVLVLFDEPMWSGMEQVAPFLEQQGTVLELLPRPQVLERMPFLKPEFFQGGIWLPQDGQIDVNELLWGYLRHAKRAGAVLRCEAEVTDLRVKDGRVRAVVTKDGEFECDWVVNTAGAWAGELARMADAQPIELTPLKRTVASFDPPESMKSIRWPMIGNESHELYIAPEAGGLIACPMDQEPSKPCDARPEELQVAIAMDRLEKQMPELLPRSLRRKWAGLRTFSPDRLFVIGEDPKVKGFFWLAGQGGCGIATSPTVCEIAADLLLDGKTDRFDQEELSPLRFS
jgi:D-arginine dehydrogenase